jgi:type I restriction enzyme S subunit
MTQTQKQNVPKLRFPEFEGDWQKRKLGELGPVSMCKRVMKDETKPSGDVPFYKIGTFGREPDAFIDRELFDRYLERYPFPKTGDVLISAAGTIGRLVVYDGSPAYFQDSNIVWVANDERDVSNKFLLSCYQNTRWTTEDTTIARLYNDNLRNIDISAPTLPEQRKIARFLSAVDTKIAQLAEKKHLLEDYKKGCMQQLFSQKIRFKDDDGNDFPDWVEKRLGSMGRFTGGGTPDTNVEDYWMGETPWISSSDLSEGLIRNLRITRWITQDAIKSSATQVTPEGAILIVTRVGIGKCAIAPKDLCTSQDFTNFVPEQGVNAFFAYWLSYNQGKLQSLAQGTSIKGITTHDLKALKLRLPHPAEQRKIADFLTALDTKIDLVAQELTHARSFKAGLLQQMFV